jgi:hypothetical protein
MSPPEENNSFSIVFLTRGTSNDNPNIAHDITDLLVQKDNISSTKSISIYFSSLLILTKLTKITN